MFGSKYTSQLIIVTVALLCKSIAGRSSLNSFYKYEKERKDVCTLQQGSCYYELQIKSRDCMLSDMPTGGAGSTSTARRNTPTEKFLDPPPEVATAVENSVEKMAEIERKLVNMMEGLSIRSLRHIRKIRADLEKMSAKIDLMKQQRQQQVQSGAVFQKDGTGLDAGGGGGRSRRGNSVLAATVSGGRVCPPEFVIVGVWSSCYRFSAFNATWHEAREYCYAFGANLIALDTMKESYILDYLLKSNQELLRTKGWWTSGNYIVRNRRWMWTSRQHLTPMTFQRWAPREPNARSTMHCLKLHKPAGYMWHDASCLDRQNFICEIEL